jgi:hypothetical protein
MAEADRRGAFRTLHDSGRGRAPDRDGQQVHAETSALNTKSPPNPKQLLTGDRMALDRFGPGFYTLQVVVTDKLAAEKQRIAARFMDFEIRP